MTNRYSRPAFVGHVRATGVTLGHSDLFDKWLSAAQSGNVFGMISLRDYGLIPETTDELRVQLDEYKTMISQSRIDKAKLGA
jgi:hypothetical protein